MTSSPPDGGWGWVIVGSSLMCNLLVDGLGLAYGVLLPKFSEYFNASKSKVSLVGTVLIGVYMCIGPISSGLINKFGCRAVCIAGSVLSALGFIIASFSPSLNILIISYGVIGGLGFGMIYLPSIVSVGIYFEKKLPLATGIAVCGSGIGTFVFAPVVEYLSENFDWRNMLLIEAGILLNGVACGMLFRPLNGIIIKDKQSSISYQQKQKATLVKFIIEEETNTVVDRLDIDNQKQPNAGSDNALGNPVISIQQTPFDYKSDQNRSQKRKSSFLKSSSQISSSGNLSKFSIFLHTLNNTFDLALYCNKPFVLLYIGNIFTAAGFYIPLMYIVDNALMLGIRSAEAAWLLSTIGIANTVGRLVIGGLTTLISNKRLLLHNMALFIASVTVFVLPLLTRYSELLVFGVLYGMCLASIATLSPVIVCEFLGADRLASAYGHLGITKGIASVVGPFLAGMFYQRTGSYDISFYFGGGMFLASSIVNFLVMSPYVKKYSVKGAKYVVNTCEN